MINKPIHITAKSSHYDKEAENYDRFNEEDSKIINQCIENILKEFKVKSILDLSCGTGSQVIWLTKKKFNIIGCDINSKMLEIARYKAIKEQLDVKFIKGDMRTAKAGKFDAVITIFNSIGHLTKEDFIKAIKNIYSNLNDAGLYIFDIFNLNYLLKDNNITKLTIDWLKRCGDTTVREIQYSTINSDGILASYDIYHKQKLKNNPSISHSFQTLQIYTAKQLKIILEKNGFELLKQYNINCKNFDENKTERILTIARKK
jgi:ubiquinone/menaquinone biosynthesis C-methylase UbiE